MKKTLLVLTMLLIFFGCATKEVILNDKATERQHPVFTNSRTYYEGLKREYEEAVVVEVIDGDTVIIERRVDSSRTKTKSTLRLVDAPEITQSFGEEAKKILSAKLLNKSVEVRLVLFDHKYLLVDIYVGKHFVNIELIEEGAAWFKGRSCISYEQKAGIAAQEKARRAKVGLWADPNPIHPSDFRINLEK